MYNNKNVRHFCIVDFPKENMLYGNFTSTIPKKAANDAFSALTKYINISDEDSFGKFIVFVIKDKHNNKMYKYIGNKIKLKKPVIIRKNGKDIIYHYKNVIGKYNPELDKI